MGIIKGLLKKSNGDRYSKMYKNFEKLTNNLIDTRRRLRKKTTKNEQLVN